MEFDQLRKFVMLADELHFGRAAKRLHISQPPLSRHIKLLEEEVGVPLFERTSRNVKIMPAGQAFLKEAREALARHDAAIAAAVNASKQPSGSISIGFVGASTYAFLPRLARALNDRLPWLSVKFHELTSVTQLEALELNRMDIGLMRPVDGVEGYERLVVMQEPLVAALPMAHRLAQRRRIELPMLNDEAIIGFSRESPYLQALLRDLFKRAGVKPHVVQELPQSQAILSLVSAGLGLAVLPSGTSNASFDDVVFRSLRLDVRQTQDYGVDLVAVWKRETNNRSRSAVLDLLNEFHQNLA
ncbi:LysR family transcriptional regulator [Brucella intermedia]|uniref:LysR family transcriptional regulator n=1 Tax=Brucella intermedia TaxID=94625 RepID=UPI00224AD1C2|nr:LysR family transcriptional regulator [Brucella intermedia]